MLNSSQLHALKRKISPYAAVREEFFDRFQEQHRHFSPDRSPEAQFLRDHLDAILDILLDLHADQTSIFAILLLGYEEQESWASHFGEETVALIKGFRLLCELDFTELGKSDHTDEILRQMFVAFVKDLRVVLMYLAVQISRLKVLLLSPHPVSERDKVFVSVLMRVFVPVTSRLGMHRLKRTLEELCFEYLYPEHHKDVRKLYVERFELRDDAISRLTRRLELFLLKHQVKAEVSGRVKSLYSTFCKMKRLGSSHLDGVYDLLALRVVVDSVLTCYEAMALLNTEYVTIASRFKDYIAAPKPNGYKSLHLVVLGLVPGFPDVPVEVQIRTQEMHLEAEYGVASHWWYAEASVKRGKKGELRLYASHPDKMAWLSNLSVLRGGEVFRDAGLRLDLFSDQIYVLTLSNEVVRLPKGSTPVDFAYHISNELGHRCFKAKVNGKVVPLDYELESGDKVFIVPKLDASPSPFWLSFVKSDTAEEKIRAYLALQRKEVASGVSAESIGSETQEVPRVKALPMAQGGQVFVGGYPDMNVKFAPCCSPTRGDSIIGYVTRGGFVSLHKKDCAALHVLDRRRYIDASFEEDRTEFQRQIHVVTNKPGMLLTLGDDLRKKAIPLTSFRRKTESQGKHTLELHLRFRDQLQFSELLEKWRQTDGVDRVLFGPT